MNSIDLSSFGWAVQLLKQGKLAYRENWNGKGMYLILIKGNIVEKAIAETYGDPTNPSQFLPVSDAIYMKTADNKLIPWLASQSDILAMDWNERVI